MSADEAQQKYIQEMGEALGTQFAALWQELAHVHLKWGEFVTLFGSKPTRIRILNQGAGNFFGLIQRVLWDDTLIHIARLTDPPDSGRGRTNLTLLNLPNLVDHPATKAKVTALLQSVTAQTAFCRDWRNRRIAHRDLDIALNTSATPLKPASRKAVKDALAEIVKVMNAVEIHYSDAATSYNNPIRAHHGHAIDLLYVLDDGIEHQKERREREKRGEWDRPVRDL